MSVHSFDTDVAAMVGTTAATIAYNIKHWCEKNAANGTHEHEGRNWTYNSVSAFKKLFPYLSPKQIRTALDKLEAAGLIVSGCFNQHGRDQTKWYSFEPSAVVNTASCPKGQMQLPKKANPFAQKGRPLPDSKPDNKPTVVVAREKPDVNYSMMVRDRIMDAAGLDDTSIASSPRLIAPTEIIYLLKPVSGEPCDLELDVLPAIQVCAAQLAARGQTLTSWSYCREAIIRNRDRRLTAAPDVKPSSSHSQHDGSGHSARSNRKPSGGGLAATALRIVAENRGYGN